MRWEKTVEYLFVGKLAIGRPAFFAAPLSGKHERGAGDAIATNASELFLIEFKASKSELDSERTKFEDYGQAETELKDIDSHHLLIYGHFAQTGTVELRAKTYFSRESSNVLLDVGGANWQDFSAYLERLLFFRKADGRSSQQIELADYSQVIGVTSKGGFAGSTSLTRFIADFPPKLSSPVELDNAQQEESKNRPGSRRPR